MLAGLGYFRFSERDCEVGTGMRRAVVRFSIKPLMFEEEYRIVGADGGAEQAARVEGRRWEHNAQARDVREHHLAGLAVIDSAAVEIAADRNADDHARGNTVMRAPALGLAPRYRIPPAAN